MGYPPAVLDRLLIITDWEIKSYLKMTKERKILSHTLIFIHKIDMLLDIQVSIK